MPTYTSGPDQAPEIEPWRKSKTQDRDITTNHQIHARMAEKGRYQVLTAIPHGESHGMHTNHSAHANYGVYANHSTHTKLMRVS